MFKVLELDPNRLEARKYKADPVTVSSFDYQRIPKYTRNFAPKTFFGKKFFFDIFVPKKK